MGQIYQNLTPDEIMQLEFQAGKKATEMIDEIISNKLNAQLSAADNGKILQVGADGKVVPMTSSEGLTIDDTLSVSGAAADAKAAGSRLSELENAFRTFVPNSFEWEQGSIDSSSGTDGASGARIRTPALTSWPSALVPDEGYKTEIAAWNGSTYLGMLQADGTFAKSAKWFNASVDISELSATSIRILLALDVSGSSTPISTGESVHLKVRGYTDMTVTLKGKAADAKAVRDLHDLDAEVLSLHNPDNDLIGYYLASPDDTTVDPGVPASNANSNVSEYIPVRGGEILVGHGFRRYWWYTDNEGTTISTTSSNNLSTQQLIDEVSGARAIVVPATAQYMRFSYRARGTEADTNTYLYRMPFGAYWPTGGKKYVALGSSSVAGTYSEIGNPQSLDTVPRFSFVQWIARINGYSLVNLGVGGMGWRNKSKASGGGRNAAETIDHYYQPEADPPVNEFADADIITLYFGTNDWKGQWGASDTDAGDGWTLGDMTSEAATDGTVIGAMKYTLEKLIEAAPQAQIIVVLPGNFKKLGNAKTGDESNPEIDVVDGISYAKVGNRYALGTHNVKGDTLADYHAAIKECAEYYGVRFVNAGEICAANLLNIDHMLGDGIHPTVEYYKQMGYALAPFIK